MKSIFHTSLCSSSEVKCSSAASVSANRARAVSPSVEFFENFQPWFVGGRLGDSAWDALGLRSASRSYFESGLWFSGWAILSDRSTLSLLQHLRNENDWKSKFGRMINQMEFFLGRQIRTWRQIPRNYAGVWRVSADGSITDSSIVIGKRHRRSSP